MRRATDRSTEPGGHLEAAWRAAYGIKPEPTVAYAEAIKAIEAVLIPLTVPNDQRATLSHALGHLRSTEGQWELAIADKHCAPAGVAPLIDLASLVWDGHRSRHAGTRTTMPVSSEAAEMAVHAAAMIVSWISRGGVRRR